MPVEVPPPQDTQKPPRSSTAEVVSHSLARVMRLNRCKSSASKSHVMLNGKPLQGSGGGTNRGLLVKIVPGRRVVLTETVAMAAFVPSMEEDAGETSHVE